MDTMEQRDEVEVAYWAAVIAQRERKATEDLLSVNAVLRTQLAQATDEAAALRRELADACHWREVWKERAGDHEEDCRKLAEAQAEARELRAGQAVWIADEDGGHTLVLAQEVADVGTTLSGRVAWRVEMSALKCDGWLAIGEGESEKEAILRAQRIVEAVTGVRP